MNKQIEEMAKIIGFSHCGIQAQHRCTISCDICIAEELYNAGYCKVNDDEVVISKKEYERMKSLYEESQGAYMTSSIGDLPLTVEGLRRAVDEITRLNIVQVELQELNMRYYNEAKQLRRDSKETAREILQELQNRARKEKEEIDIGAVFFEDIEELAEKFGVEVE